MKLNRAVWDNLTNVSLGEYIVADPTTTKILETNFICSGCFGDESDVPTPLVTLVLWHPFGRCWCH